MPPRLLPASERVLKLARALGSPHTRKKQALVLVEGAKAVQDAARAGPGFDLVLVRAEAGAAGTPDAGGWAPLPEPVAAALAVARQARGPDGGPPPAYAAAPAAFDAAADAVHAQGILAVMREPRCERAALLDPTDPRPLAVLDRLQDPGNLGASLRTAAALGFRGALLTRGTTDPFAPKVVRAAAATVARFPILAGESAEAEIADLAAAGWSVIAAADPGEPPRQAFAGLPPGRPVALWVGNEGQGIAPGVAAAAARRVWLPIAPGVESLNAAVAFGILGYALTRGGGDGGGDGGRRGGGGGGGGGLPAGANG